MRIVVVVLPLAHAQEVVDPVASFGAVGVVDDEDRKPLLAFRVENDGSLVQPFDVDAFAGRDVHPSGLLFDVEERVARLGLEQPQRVAAFAAEIAVRKVDRVKFAALDLRVHAALVEVLGQAHRMFEERLRIVEDSACEVPDLVAPEVGLVVEVVALLALEAAEEIGRERAHQPFVGDLCREFGRDRQGFVLRFVADDVYGQRFDARIFGV